VATAPNTSSPPRGLEWLSEARAAPAGARFFRCALQVNPYAYVQRHGRGTAYADEGSYNAALVGALRAADVELIAVTDHFRVRDSVGLMHAARQAGLTVLPGFEAMSSDGVHMLCLFETDTPIEKIERYVGELGVHDDGDTSPLSPSHDAVALLERCAAWGAACIPHTTGDRGLLGRLSGQSRIRAWRCAALHAISLPGVVAGAPEELRPILENRNVDYRRERLPAVLNANDVTSPDDVTKSTATTLIKMTRPGLGGLHQAFLDPQSRVRLNTDPEPEARTCLLALHWEGGFLDGITLRLNDDLNVLVGSPGAGKSTILESLRYVLDLEANGDGTKEDHASIVRYVLRSGTRVAVWLRSPSPSPTEYVVERVVPNPPTVRDAVTGRTLSVHPRDLTARPEVHGQHELAEIARDPDRRTRLLDRFLDRDPDAPKLRASLARQLESVRERIIRTERERERLREHLEALPRVEETLRRFQEAGVEEQLADQTQLDREERLITQARARVRAVQDSLTPVRAEVPIDTVFVSPPALEQLPGGEQLRALHGALDRLSADAEAGIGAVDAALQRARRAIDDVEARWLQERRQPAQVEYERTLRELQKSDIDGNEFVRLRRELDELRPLGQDLERLARVGDELRGQRRDLLAEWEEFKAKELRTLDRAAKRVTRRLRGTLRVTVSPSANREPLFELLRGQVGGRLGETCEALRAIPDLSLRGFADAARRGRNELVSQFAIPESQAQRISEADEATLMRIEELELPVATQLELNIAPGEDDERWQRLEELSKGQKATAIMLLLLLESRAPLVVDQPEDDLDNRFITDGIVPRMREEKRRRQFLFATHNPNVPVLGDAELIAGLTPAGEADGGTARIAPEHLGSIDVDTVRALVEEQLEGGHEAFEMRRLKYGH